MPATSITSVDPVRLADARRGYVFHATSPGVAPGVAIANSAPFAVRNLPGSGIDLVVVSGGVAYVSGALGAGTVYWCEVEGPIEGTAVEIVNALIGTELVPAAAHAVSNTAVLSPATFAAARPIRPFVALGALGGASEVAPWAAVDRVDGGIIVPPGCGLAFAAAAAPGTNPLVTFSMTWTIRPASESQE